MNESLAAAVFDDDTESELIAVFFRGAAGAMLACAEDYALCPRRRAGRVSERATAAYTACARSNDDDA